MTRNMGVADRLIRTVIALGIAVAYFSGAINGTLAIVLGVIALVFLLTSLIGFCPAYAMLGLSTCRKIHPSQFR